ncbi:MAG: DNA polymerase IV [Pseudomonadota bacterium]
MPALCRDCLTADPGPRCRACGSPRQLAHAELLDLSIAHLDCDAFYASVEKRDNPELRDRPVIVGGGRRGVVSTACYIARIRGVRSAMPMFKALDLCPDAAVVKPRMETYVAVSREIRALMEALTPAVEPLSLDEAFLDLTGTERLHGAPPAVLLARLQAQIEAEIGVTASIGLAPNKFLAKIASDLDKPRGFSVIGRAETESFLDAQPVSIIWGVGRAFQETLAADGIRTIPDLKARDRKDLSRRYGAMGERLWHLARGLDQRSVSTRSAAKSVSNETTFGEDTGDPDLLEGHLWRLAEKVADRLKAKEIAGRVVTLKLKRSNHRLLTRSHTLSEPTQMAHLVFETAHPLLRAAMTEGPFRLIGVGISQLTDGAEADRAPDLLDPSSAARTASERATDAIREKFGSDAIVKGRTLR